VLLSGSSEPSLLSLRWRRRWQRVPACFTKTRYLRLKRRVRLHAMQFNATASQILHLVRTQSTSKGNIVREIESTEQEEQERVKENNSKANRKKSMRPSSWGIIILVHLTIISPNASLGYTISNAANNEGPTSTMPPPSGNAPAFPEFLPGPLAAH